MRPPILLLAAAAFVSQSWSTPAPLTLTPQRESASVQTEVPLVANGFARVTRHEELLRYLAAIANSSGRLSVETIGTSKGGREIPVVRVRTGDAGAPGLRVLLFCQQHGNEASGKEAALLLLQRIVSGTARPALAALDLAIVPSVNPDGNESGKRVNAAGADLNRNHLILTQPEVLALHVYAARFRPEVTLDVHEYQPHGRDWTAAGSLRRMDEQFGAPTHPNVARTLVELGSRELFPFLKDTLAREGLLFFDYLILDSPNDSARHSTTSVNDGRQSFAIRQRFAFILEGRNARSPDEELQRRSLAQLSAIEAFLEFAGRNAVRIRSAVAEAARKAETGADEIVLQTEYRAASEEASIDVPVRHLATGAEGWLKVPYRSIVQPLKTIPRPSGYVIRRDRKELAAFLQRHGVRFETVREPRSHRLEVLRVTGTRTARLEGRSQELLETASRLETVQLQPGDLLVPIAQEAGTLVAIALEPESQWGLVTYEEFGALRSVGADYPVMRLPRGD